MRIPYAPFKTEVVLRYSRKFNNLSGALLKFFPSLIYELKQCKMEIKPREYLGAAIFSALFYLMMLLVVTIVLGLFFSIMGISAFDFQYIMIMLSVSVGATFFVFFNIIWYPKITLSRKVRQIDKDLLYALRHLLIQVRSGVTLFNSLVSVSTGDYGVLSKEFDETVKEINAGVPEIEALENMGWRNPSLFLRRVVWQMVNGMRAGSDIGATLKEIVNALSMDQRIEIRRYGATLNPLALMYLMTAVIIPTLGITFLVILTSFFGLVAIPLDVILYVVLFFLVFFQFMFLGIIKLRRPAMEV